MDDRLEKIIVIEKRICSIESEIKRNSRSAFGEYIKTLGTEKEINTLKASYKLNMILYIEERLTKLLKEERRTLPEKEYWEIYHAEYEYYLSEGFSIELEEYRNRYYKKLEME